MFAGVQNLYFSIASNIRHVFPSLLEISIETQNVMGEICAFYNCEYQ